MDMNRTNRGNILITYLYDDDLNDIEKINLDIELQNKLNKVVGDYINSKKIRRVLIADDELISDKLKSDADEKLAKITEILNGNYEDYDAMANAIKEIEGIIDGGDTQDKEQ